MYYTYILQSEKDQSFYTGYTSDLEHRLYEHNEGFSRYTKHKRPWKMVYVEEFKNKSDAIKRERFLKKQKNRDFYNRLISDNGK